MTLPINGPEPHAFSLRLWPHDTGAGSIEWRGRVHDLGSGESRYFRDWEALLTFLRVCLASPTDTAAREDAGGSG